MAAKIFEHLDNLASWKLDDRVKRLLEGSGFETMCNVTGCRHNGKLISEMAKYFNDKMGYFEFPNFTLCFGLRDVLYITGLHISGKPITGIDEPDPIPRCLRCFGEDLCIRKKGRVSGFIKLSDLKHKFMLLPPNSSQEDLHKSARAYVMYVLGSSLFADSNGVLVPTMYLQFVENVVEIKDYAWGAALLAHLYVSLYRYKHSKCESNLGGSTICLQIFALLCLPPIRKLVLKNQENVKAKFPLILPWTKALELPSLDTRTKVDFASAFDARNEDEVVWQPYSTLPANFLPRYLKVQEKLATKATALINFNKVAVHLPFKCKKHWSDWAEKLEAWNIQFTGKKCKTRNGKRSWKDWSTCNKGPYKKFCDRWNQTNLERPGVLSNAAGSTRLNNVNIVTDTNFLEANPEQTSGLPCHRPNCLQEVSEHQSSLVLPPVFCEPSTSTAAISSSAASSPPHQDTNTVEPMLHESHVEQIEQVDPPETNAQESRDQVDPKSNELSSVNTPLNSEAINKMIEDDPLSAIENMLTGKVFISSKTQQYATTTQSGPPKLQGSTTDSLSKELKDLIQTFSLGDLVTDYQQMSKVLFILEELKKNEKFLSTAQHTFIKNLKLFFQHTLTHHKECDLARMKKVELSQAKEDILQKLQEAKHRKEQITMSISNANNRINEIFSCIEQLEEQLSKLKKERETSQIAITESGKQREKLKSDSILWAHQAKNLLYDLAETETKLKTLGEQLEADKDAYVQFNASFPF